MAIEEDSVKSGYVVYSCNCGWIDTGHANPKSGDLFVGAESLWNQLTKETGTQNSRKPGANGFKVTYIQKVVKFGFIPITIVIRNYFVKHGLSTLQKERVALAIFMEVSEAFESQQKDSALGLGELLKHSSFSQEDLISNLLGFYKAVRKLDYEKPCRVLELEKSLEVFQKMSGQERIAKSSDWASPVFYPCKHCSKAEFPREFRSIVPAPKGGKDPLFRQWTREDEVGIIPKVKPKQPPRGVHQRRQRLQGEGLKMSSRRSPGKNFNLKND